VSEKVVLVSSSFNNSSNKYAVNNCQTTLLNDVSQAAKTRDGDDHCTITFGKYQITNHINGFDSWGWDAGNNYKKNEFDFMLSGSLALNHNKDGQNVIYPMDPTHSIDAVVLVMDYASIENTDENFIFANLKELVEAAQNRGIKAICFAVTHVDKLVNESYPKGFGGGPWRSLQPSSAMAFVQDCPRFINISKKVIKHLGSAVRIFPIANYTDTITTKNDVIDSCATALLLYIIRKLKVTTNTEIPPFDLFAGETPLAFTFKPY
jgi:hypothetical protein